MAPPPRRHPQPSGVLVPRGRSTYTHITGARAQTRGEIVTDVRACDPFIQQIFPERLPCARIPLGSETRHGPRRRGTLYSGGWETIQTFTWSNRGSWQCKCRGEERRREPGAGRERGEEEPALPAPPRFPVETRTLLARAPRTAGPGGPGGASRDSRRHLQVGPSPR